MRANRQHPDRPLPAVTVEAAVGDIHHWTEAAVRGTLCNPVYAGLGPFPQIVDDETWVRAAARVIRTEGPEQFLVNMLHVLRQSFEPGVTGSERNDTAV